MRKVKGKYDGTHLRLEEEVHIDHEVPVVVTFPELPPTGKLDELLLSGPQLDEDELAAIEGFIEEFRRWKV